MGTIKVSVPHGLKKDEAKVRVQKLLDDWGAKYGLKSTWDGHTAALAGKAMGMSLDGHLQIFDGRIEVEATDPGFLFREKAKKYVAEKVNEVLGPPV